MNEKAPLQILENVAPGTPIAILSEGKWWPYRGSGDNSITPVGSNSYLSAKQALKAARAHQP